MSAFVKSAALALAISSLLTGLYVLAYLAAARAL
jgi:hypothetical protein